MGRQARSSEIVRKQESLALRMLKQADSDSVQVDIQLDIFDKVSKWVSISNKLEGQEETDIDRFKRRISGEGEADKPKHYPPSRRPKGWKPPEQPGPRLAALKGRLPAGDVSGTSRDSSGGGSADSDAA